jgi:PAS domain S-box-containing protein
MTTSTSLAVLIVEDRESDAQLVVRALSQAGYDVVPERVETAAEMRAALAKQAWDVVISDYSLPQFNGPAALTLLHEMGLDIPFIVVSGTIGEETAVAMMKAGAHDYLLKGNLARLAPAVERELAQTRIRRERKQAAQTLAASEKRFRAMVENAVDAISLFGAEGTVIYDSPAAVRLLGYAPRELTGRNAFALVHPDDLPRVAHLFQQLLQDPATPVNSLFRFRHKNDSWRWIEATASNLLAEPSVQAVVINYRDITERQQAELALQQSEERYRVISDMVSDYAFSFRVNPDGSHIREWTTEAFERITGYRPDDPRMARGLGELVHPDDLTILQARTQRLLAGQPDTSEFRILHRDGSVRWISNYGYPIIDSTTGRVTHIYGAAQDITERKRAEEVLRETEIHLRVVLNNAPITIFATDRHGVFTLSEGKGLEHVGLKPGENVGVSAFDLYGSFPFVEHTGKVTAGKDVIQRVLAGETVTAFNELRG